MYDRKKKRHILPLFLLLLLLVGCLCFGVFRNSGDDMEETTRNAIRQTVIDSARQCYAVEGVYPESLEYLEENYGLRINTEKYYVQYSAFSANVLPEIKVVRKTEDN